MSIYLSARTSTEISQHAGRALPEECCGFILGLQRPDASRQVAVVVPATNVAAAERDRQFLIDPPDLLGAVRLARRLELEVLGVYHSHPNRAAHPSELDRRGAVPHWSYVIVGCGPGRPTCMRSWRLRADGAAFDEELLFEELPPAARCDVTAL